MPAPKRLKDPEYLKHTVLDFRQMSVFVQQPLIFERAEGVHYWDIDGKQYLDGISGIFVVSLGHGNQRIIEAARKQMETISFVPTLHGGNVPAFDLSARLAEIAPEGMETVKLASSGSEATEAAMKLARQFWKQTGHPGKYKVISRYYGYHGATTGSMAASGTPSRKLFFEPFPAGYVHVPTVHCYDCPFQQDCPGCQVFCAEYLRQVIEMEGPETVSCVIVEPIGNTGGILTPPAEYLPKLREICDDLNVLLIFDEMITGMGRTGNLFAANTYGVTPDILCLGKGLSSGYAPLAAAVWNERVQDAFWGPEDADIAFGHGHTYAGNPVSSAVGLEAIAILTEGDMLEQVRAKGAYLEKKLREMGERVGIFGEVRGAGMLWGVEFAKDPATREYFATDLRIGKQIGTECQERGLIIRNDPDWVALAPPFISTTEELDEMCQVLEDSINVVLARV